MFGPRCQQQRYQQNIQTLSSYFLSDPCAYIYHKSRRPRSVIIWSTCSHRLGALIRQQSRLGHSPVPHPIPRSCHPTYTVETLLQRRPTTIVFHIAICPPRIPHIKPLIPKGQAIQQPRFHQLVRRIRLRVKLRLDYHFSRLHWPELTDPMRAHRILQLNLNQLPCTCRQRMQTTHRLQSISHHRSLLDR